MKNSESTAAMHIENDEAVRRAMQLARRSSLRQFSVEEMLARVPDDWQPGEADVDEFLNSLRGRGEK